MSEPPTSYEQLVATAGEGLGNACRVYGISPFYGRLYAALFLSAEPVSLGELVDRLGVAKSTVSVAVRKLVAFGMVRRLNKPGDRRDYYAIVDDPLAILTHILRNFVTAELEEGIKVTNALQQGLADPAGEGWPDEEGLALLRSRSDGLAQFTHLSAQVVGALIAHPEGITRGHLADLAGALTQAEGDLARGPSTRPGAPHPD
jgi:DNA-binding transcriptional regulator GbsR (MarR family)